MLWWQRIRKAWDENTKSCFGEFRSIIWHNFSNFCLHKQIPKCYMQPDITFPMLFIAQAQRQIDGANLGCIRQALNSFDDNKIQPCRQPRKTNLQYWFEYEATRPTPESGIAWIFLSKRLDTISKESRHLHKHRRRSCGAFACAVRSACCYIFVLKNQMMSSAFASICM